MTRTLARLTSVAILLVVGGCGGPNPAERDAAATTAPLAAVPVPASAPEPARPTACALVTAAEMSAILGRVVNSESDDEVFGTNCSYRALEGLLPFAKIEVDWGSGSGAMAATGMLGRAEPGITSPLDGLGDRASQVGPMLWVQVGEDLLMITLTGVDDNVATAKRIVETLRPRLPHAS